MDQNKRKLLMGGLGVGAGLAITTSVIHPASARRSSRSFIQDRHILDARLAGLRPNSRRNQSAVLQKAVYKAQNTGRILFLPAGKYKIANIKIPSNCEILGIAGKSQLISTANAPVFTAHNISGIIIRNLVFSGENKQTKEGLLSFRHVSQLDVSHCLFEQAGHNALHLENCAGVIHHNEIRQAKETGIFSMDAKGLEVSHNHIHSCQNNGIQVWQEKQRPDRTLILGNRIEHIRAARGGNGQYGNGINIFRADGVQISNNMIRKCTFSAIRNNAGSDCQILHNQCHDSGEVAIYVEFSFEGAIVSQNLVNTAGTGISITNFREGGRLAVVQGNLVRNISGRSNEDGYGSGIHVEADTVVSSNVIENSLHDGISIGWGQYMRDVMVNNNLIRKAGVGIGISTQAAKAKVNISGNMLSGSVKGAIRAKDYHKYTGPDLAHEKRSPYENITLLANITSN